MSRALLEKPNLEPAVRIRDVSGFLVHHYCKQCNCIRASHKREKLQKRKALGKVWYSIRSVVLKHFQKHTGPMFERNPYVNENNEVEKA